ncbi:MAG: hypothetical protein ACLFPU_06015 [Dehalococcoidia bacterium]
MREVHLRLWQLIAAAVIFFLAGTHLVIMHLDNILSFFGAEAGDPMAWSSVAERASSAGWTVFYGIVVAAVLYHGFLGLRNVISELSLSPAAVRVLNRTLIVVGIGIFAFALYIPIST